MLYLVDDMTDQVILQFSTTKNSISWWPPFFPNWASWLIRHMTHSPFSHVDIELPDGTLLGSSDSPKAKVLSGNPRGVAIRPADYEDYGSRFRMIIKTDKADAIFAAAKSQLGKPFDNAALKGFLSDALPGERDWGAADKWFCSELAVWAFLTAKYWDTIPGIWPKNRVSPSDILLIFLFDPNWTNRDTFWQGNPYPMRVKVRPS